MADPKIKPVIRVAGKSKFRLPERSPRVAVDNPMREILQEARAQEEALTAQETLQSRPTPAKRIAGVGQASLAPTLKNQSPSPPAKISPETLSPSTLTPAPDRKAFSTFAEFSKRWSPILRSGQMSVCRTIFEMTHGLGQHDCFTSMPKLAQAAGIKERQCYNVVAQLEQLGFIERPDIFNTPTQKGTVFCLHLEPRSPANRTERRYHIGEYLKD